MSNSYPKNGKTGSYSAHSTEKMKDGWGGGTGKESETSYPKKLRGVNMSYEKFQVKDYSLNTSAKPGKDYPAKRVKFGTEENI